MRTLVNMIERLGDSFEFKVITRDHDGPLNRETYRDVRVGEWNRVGKADVYYLAKDRVNLRHLRQLISDGSPDAIYLNSFFSPLTVFVLILRKFHSIPRIPMILAPEGEFSKGALRLKGLKKQLYISTAKLLGLVDNIVWKAAAEAERDDIIRVLGPQKNVKIAANMPPLMIYEDFDISGKPLKSPGSVRMAFLSRFMRKKNFNWLVPHLYDTQGELLIDIWGPLEDEEYWRETQELMRKLPPAIKIESKGPVSHERVSETLARYHFFILPTLGENFGHVFIEAMAAGCPVITSDQTPWRELKDKGAGWDLSLDRPGEWKSVIDQCIAMNADAYLKRSRRVRDFALAWLSDPQLEADNREVIETAISHR